VNGYTAMHLLRSGNDVNMVSYWLGHADINTTHIYVEIDMEMKRQMLQKAGPPAVKEPLPWQKPNVLQWLNALAKAPQLCAANY
jgi:integrase/recombinase XerD